MRCVNRFRGQLDVHWTSIRFERVTADLGHDAWTSGLVVTKAPHRLKRGSCRTSAWYAAPLLMGAATQWKR